MNKKSSLLFFIALLLKFKTTYNSNVSWGEVSTAEQLAKIAPESFMGLRDDQLYCIPKEAFGGSRRDS